MKSRRRHLSPMIFLLALMVQPTFVSQGAEARQNALSPAAITVTAAAPIPQRMRRRNWTAHCRARCQRDYNLCTRGMVPPGVARCRQRLRACLRRCR